MANTSNPYDYLIKFVLTGDASIGKTSLMNQFCDNYFEANYLTTIGVDFKFKTINVNDKKIKIQIWDTAGQERFRSITTSYYRGSNVVLLIFDLTNINSFQNLDFWYNSILDNNHDPNLQIYLVANKKDLDCDTNIIPSNIKKLVKNSKIIKYYEVSAKSCEGILEMFEDICINCIEKNNFKKNSLNLDQKIENNSYNKNNCC